MKKELILTLGIAAIIILGAVFLGFYLNRDEGRDVAEDMEPIACTMDAKICPDGTAVGRVGPNCEFAECPSAPVSTPPTESPDTLEGGAELDMGIGDASTPPSLSADMACKAQGGTWNGQYRECVGIGRSQCSAIGGRYDDCASACRHDPDAEVCTMQCVEVCTVE